MMEKLQVGGWSVHNQPDEGLRQPWLHSPPAWRHRAQAHYQGEAHHHAQAHHQRGNHKRQNTSRHSIKVARLFCPKMERPQNQLYILCWCNSSMVQYLVNVLVTKGWITSHPLWTMPLAWTVTSAHTNTSKPIHNRVLCFTWIQVQAWIQIKTHNTYHSQKVHRQRPSCWTVDCCYQN